MRGPDHLYTVLIDLTVYRLNSGHKKCSFLNVTSLLLLQVMSIILYFSAFVALLYHIGIMLYVIKKIGWLNPKDI